MTQTLQQALLKAGLISQDKLKKAEADKKAAQRAQQARQHQGGPQRPYPGSQGPQGPKPFTSGRPDQRPQQGAPRPAMAANAAPAPTAPARPAQRPSRPPAPLPPVHKKPEDLSEGKHAHHIRTDCDACGRPSPDVEYYEHKNRSLDKYWLCVKCADANNILDDCRQTSQSSQSQRGLFQRGYGHTKRR